MSEKKVVPSELTELVKEVMSSELVSVKEAAKILATSPSTVRRMIKDGLLGHIARKAGKTKGTRYKVIRSTIEAYIRERTKFGEPITEKYEGWENEK